MSKLWTQLNSRIEGHQVDPIVLYYAHHQAVSRCSLPSKCLMIK